MLSIILTASVLYPDITGEQILWVLAGGTLLGFAGFVVTATLQRRAKRAPGQSGYPRLLEDDRSKRLTWRMPPLSDLEPIHLSLSRRVWMIVLRGYLVVAVGMVLVRVVQLALGEG